MDFVTGLPKGHQLQLNPGYRLSADKDDYTPFWCAFHKDINPRSRSKATNELADDMQTELSAQIWHSKSLSAGPLGLRAWISLLINCMSQYTRLKIWQISLWQTLWVFKHRLGYKLGIKSKCQHTIKAQSLETTLPTIIFICDVFHMSLLEQDTTKKGWVYENATKTLLLSCVQEHDWIRNLRLATMRSTRWKVFGTTRFL